MEKIIDVSALTDQLKILLWDRSKSREEFAELVIGLIEEAGEEIVRCKDCALGQEFAQGKCVVCHSAGGRGYIMPFGVDGFCSLGERRDSDG